MTSASVDPSTSSVATNRFNQIDEGRGLHKYKPTDVGLPSYLVDHCDDGFRAAFLRHPLLEVEVFVHRRYGSAGPDLGAPASTLT